MTEEQELLELVRGQIAGLPGDQPELVNKIAVGVRELIRRFDAHALLAIALVQAEQDAEGDESPNADSSDLRGKSTT